MSQVLIQQYLNQLATLKMVSGSTRESVTREAFKDLLKGWGRAHDLTFVPEYEIESPRKERRYVDGALLYSLRVPFGYWEAKDEHDDLDAEIDNKKRRGYPQDNIIFEDSREAVLIQNRQEVFRCPVDDTAGLEKLLKLFFGWQRPEIADFRKAVEQFKVDLPSILEALRAMIERADQSNAEFRKAAQQFLAHARDAINPSLTEADVREMLIQHVLTEELFAAVFPGTGYHKDNSVARELFKLEATFFTGNTKHQTLKALEPYYAAIRATAAQISSHHEKQTFLKAIYENFYKVYNRKAADRLGVVYTPNEIVRFMIQGADWLCEKHFGRNLIDRNVDILDPATGTGTFICELMEHFSGQPEKLKFKYEHELHANEVAILPYYVANLNIEATYAAITGEYREFPGLCFVDTLDNTAGLRKHAGHMDDLFGAVSQDNVKRIKRQNSRRISVIIGNPPYNANQLNENENNKNREYPEIDKRIKETYVEQSTAQKTKVYDMYARFFRWASDRLDENGVLAFITNRSFIESRTFDGFRATVAKEFSEIRIVDLGGDVRANPKLSGPVHNVFAIQTGVAVSFFVKNAKQRACRIYYSRRPEMERAEEKRAFLSTTSLNDAGMQEVRPNERSDWINAVSGDLQDLVPIAAKSTKSAASRRQEKAIFKLFSLGVVTARDEWVYGESRTSVQKKVESLVDAYNNDRIRLRSVRDKGKLASMLDYSIKWSRAVKRDLEKNRTYAFDPALVVDGLYRPFVTRALYFDRALNEMQYRLQEIFPDGERALAILISGHPASKDFQVLAAARVPSYDTLEKTEVLPILRHEDDLVVENVTDWALNAFSKRYEHRHAETREGSRRGRKTGQLVTKPQIVFYVYAVLHDPVYRTTYALNLRKDFPHIPMYEDFAGWAAWGKQLMDLHVGYETVEPYALTRNDVIDEKARKAGVAPRPMLKADKEKGLIILDSETTLAGVPAQAWDYMFGNRCALEWVLDQYKEKTPKDPTIREKFDTYRFVDYKERVIDLLMRVTTVSVETQRIVEAMRAVPRES